MLEFLFGSSQSQSQSQLMESDVAGFIILDKENEEFKKNLKQNSENNLVNEPKWSRDEYGRLIRLKQE